MQRDMRMLTPSGAWPEAFEEMQSISKLQENALRPGLRRRPRWGSLQRSPGL